MSGSLRNVTVIHDGKRQHGFIFSLLNPPVPLGGNVISLDIYVDDLPMSKKSIFVATQDDVINAGVISEVKPIPFKPFQSARFLVVSDSGLDEKRKHKVVVMSKMEGFEQILIPFTFVDYARRQGEKVFIPEQALEQEPSTVGEDATIFKNFTTPLVLSGQKAYIVCSSHGGLSANWTWMGVRYDNGGLYVPPARSFGRIIVEISMDEGVRKRLPSFLVSSRHENGVLQTRHELGGLEVKRRLAVPFDNRGFIMSLELGITQSPKGLEGKLEKERKQPVRKIRIHFIVDGNVTSYGLAAVSQSTLYKYDPKNKCLLISTETQKGKAAKYFATIGIAPNTIKTGRVLSDSYDNDLELSYDFEIESGKPPISLALIGTGGFTSQASCLKEYLYMRDNYGKLLRETEAGFKNFSSSTLRIASSMSTRGSDLAKLIGAYEKTKTCLRYLKTKYDGLGVGICAGFPRFPNYWARDTGWTLRGYLAVGDSRFAALAIDNFLRRQAKKTTKSAIVGELPMLISGKAFLHGTTYGSADSTFLFPRAILQYVQSTGDIVYLEKRWQSIRDLVDWGFFKDVDGDGLIENDFTGIAEKLPIQDSTWMDHIDRRKSANDIQALFFDSLSAGTELAELAGDSSSAHKWSERAKGLRDKIDLEYWNAPSGFYYDTIRKDGSKDPSVRPNALVLLLTDATKDRRKAEMVLDRIEKPDMTTPWGVRSLSSDDPRYNPTLYHDGAVWPLVTGWATLCEIKYGRKEHALAYLQSMAERILTENGMFAETYRGDRPEPFNSCILQAWSAGMYAYAFSEMMLGMRVDMIQNRIQLEPNLPESLKRSALGPIEFEHFIHSRKGVARIGGTIDLGNEKIGISFSGDKKPDIFSNSYSVTASQY